MYKKQIDYKHLAHLVCEPKNSLPSETVPDKSYSIKDILYRSMTGSMPPIAKAAEFSGDTVIPVIKDYTELDSRISEIKAKTLKARELLRQKHYAEQEAKKQAEKEKIIEEYEKSKISKNEDPS